MASRAKLIGYLPTPTPAKPGTELAASGTPRSFVLVIASAVSVTALAAAVALVVALREPKPGRTALPSRAAPPSPAAPSTPPVSEEIDVSDPAASPPPAAEVLDLAQATPLLVRDPEALLVWLERSPTGTTAEEQAKKVLQIRALVALQRVGSARTEAGAYYRQWPDGPHTAALVRLTGRHPQR
jgi:hypothetical protein